jgi:hypothetical protein
MLRSLHHISPPPSVDHWWALSSEVLIADKGWPKVLRVLVLLLWPSVGHFTEVLQYLPVDTVFIHRTDRLIGEHPPSQPPLLGFLVATRRPMSSDHFPSTCSGFSPALSRWWARHCAHSSHDRAWRLHAMHALAGMVRPKDEGLGQGPWGHCGLWWIVGFVNFF